jgi:hypothetical protein
LAARTYRVAARGSDPRERRANPPVAGILGFQEYAFGRPPTSFVVTARETRCRPNQFIRLDLLARERESWTEAKPKPFSADFLQLFLDCSAGVND